MHGAARGKRQGYPEVTTFCHVVEVVQDGIIATWWVEDFTPI